MKYICTAPDDIEECGFGNTVSEAIHSYANNFGNPEIEKLKWFELKPLKCTFKLEPTTSTTTVKKVTK